MPSIYSFGGPFSFLSGGYQDWLSVALNLSSVNLTISGSQINIAWNLVTQPLCAFLRKCWSTGNLASTQLLQKNYVTEVSKVDKFCPILLNHISGPLHRHLQHHGVDYLQFSFRWMNNLLTRELPLHCTIRLWDTYLAESDGFASFQLYVCAAFLLHWRRELLIERDFQVIKRGPYLRI